MKRAMYVILVGMVVVLGLGFLSSGQAVLAATPAPSCAAGSKGGSPVPVPAGQPCGGSAIASAKYVCLALPPLPGLGQGSCPSGQLSLSNTGPGGAIVAYAIEVIKLFIGAFGMLIVAMIVLSGFQYVTSTADPGRVKAAKTRLEGAILALFLFVIMYAVLAFLVPGGV